MSEADVPNDLRTERVTLAVTHTCKILVDCWDWRHIIVLEPGESVRVVEEPGEVAYGQAVIDRLTDERDAAIRERDEAQQRHAREWAKCLALADKVLGLRD